MKKILVVDDDAGIRKLVFRLFREGYDVQLAQSGPEALLLLKQTRPDLILLDVMMPVMDGLEVLRSSLKISPGVKVMMISGETNLHTVQKSLEIGAKGYFTKPLNILELSAGIRSLLDPLTC
jgi:DNA-binding response OmpR family regulator